MKAPEIYYTKILGKMNPDEILPPEEEERRNDMMLLEIQT